MTITTVLTLATFDDTTQIGYTKVGLLFDWFGIGCMTTDNFCFYLQNKLIQTSQTGGQLYSDTSPFSIPWVGGPAAMALLAEQVGGLAAMALLAEQSPHGPKY